MKRTYLLVWTLAIAATEADAVVIRHDVPKEKYLVAEGHPALVDMRHEGHGMLIAPEWVVSAAHTVFYDYRGRTITIGGKAREIAHVVFHSGYSKPPEGIFQGDAAPSQAYLRGNDDIVLIKLKAPVDDVTPIQMYTGGDEAGQIVTLYGRGNTGTGLTGQIQDTKGTLRKAQNRITAAEKQWLHYRFDRGADALPLEGYQGNGDSGGPAIIRKNGQDYLAGLASWHVYSGDLANFKGSLYGMDASVVRISHYRDWIADVQTWTEEKLAANHHRPDQ